jgi:uncharacterized membrane protein YkvI
MFNSRTFRKYLLPGFVFQSVVIAGGYGTGRELVEFFLGYGPLNGLLAMLLISTVIWSAVCAASFEFARIFRAYDYRSFFKNLLGKGWFTFEICYFAQLALVLAVIAAAAGSILQETFRLPYAVGVIGIMAAVGLLVFKGSTTIARVLLHTTWPSFQPSSSVSRMSRRERRRLAQAFWQVSSPSSRACCFIWP